MKNFLIINIVILLLISACDVIDAPYEEDGGNSVQKPKRNVLIEDFTGFRCGNCPPAGIEAERLMEENEGRVFAMAIHVGYLSVPTADHTYDFRTLVGNDIDEFFGMSSIGTPLGLVNRSDYNDNFRLVYGDWANAVDEQLKQTSDISISMKSDYNDANSVISVIPELIFYGEQKQSYKFNIFITESKIIEYQKWYGNNPEDIEDFEHNHVLRDAFYGAWGTPVYELFTGQGDTLAAECDFTIPANVDWKPENINLIGVVMDSDNDYEIIQVEEIHLK